MNHDWRFYPGLSFKLQTFQLTSCIKMAIKILNIVLIIVLVAIVVTAILGIKLFMSKKEKADGAS